MPDKGRFVNELARVCTPGGTVIVVTWCHRILKEGESLSTSEQSLLDRICEGVSNHSPIICRLTIDRSMLSCSAYYLPAWCSVEDYRRLFEKEGLSDIVMRDWSQEVSPFWGAVIQTALSGAGLQGLLKAGWSTIKGALVMPLMAEGFNIGLIKFVLISGKKK
jgi:tocopherol O-methyltransferase